MGGMNTLIEALRLPVSSVQLAGENNVTVQIEFSF